MNSIESRINADAASAAAEITEQDIPPLSPHAIRGRSRRLGMRGAQPGRTGAAAYLGSRRWPAALAATAGVVAIVAVTAVMITAGSGQNTAQHGTSPAAGLSPAGSHARSELAAEALDYYLPATGGQYTAGLAFGWTQLKIAARIFDSCMAESGFSQPPFSEKKQAYLRSFPDNSQFPDLRQRASTDTMTGSAYIATEPVVPKSAAGRNANRRCKAASSRPFARIGRIATPLATHWLGVVTAIQASARVHAMQPSFSACLEAHGVPTAYAQQQGNKSNPLFAGFFTWADHLSQSATSTRQQTAADHHWTPVFVQCARPTVTLFERLQLTSRARFFKQHARQITAIRTLAEDMPKAGH